MSNSKPIFQAQSKIQNFRGYIIDLLCFGVLIYCLFHFNDNPIVVSIISVVLLYTLLLPNKNKVFVYEDRIEFQVVHNWIPTIERRWNASFAEIESIDVTLHWTKDWFQLSEITNSGTMSLALWNTIIIIRKNRKPLKIATKLFKKDVTEALQLVKRLTNNKIEINGLE